MILFLPFKYTTVEFNRENINLHLSVGLSKTFSFIKATYPNISLNQPCLQLNNYYLVCFFEIEICAFGKSASRLVSRVYWFYDFDTGK